MNYDQSGVVPKNKLQQKFLDNTQEHLAPDPFTLQRIPCTISRVFERDTLDEIDLPAGLAGKFINNPGWLYAEVILKDGFRTLILPFKDSEELIYFIYGNRVLLEGRQATIVYRNQDPQNGFIELRKLPDKVHLSLNQVSNVLDIGGLL